MVFGFSEESGLKNKYIVVGGVGNAKDFGINQKTRFNVRESISFYVRNGNSFEINWTTELSNAYAMDMKVASAINTLLTTLIELTDNFNLSMSLGSKIGVDISLHSHSSVLQILRLAKQFSAGSADDRAHISDVGIMGLNVALFNASARPV